MHRASGSVYALKKSKEALMSALDENKKQLVELLEYKSTIEDLKKRIKETERARDGYKNQTEALKLVVKNMSKEEDSPL